MHRSASQAKSSAFYKHVHILQWDLNITTYMTSCNVYDTKFTSNILESIIIMVPQMYSGFWFGGGPRGQRGRGRCGKIELVDVVLSSALIFFQWSNFKLLGPCKLSDYAQSVMGHSTKQESEGVTPNNFEKVNVISHYLLAKRHFHLGLQPNFEL